MLVERVHDLFAGPGIGQRVPDRTRLGRNEPGSVGPTTLAESVLDHHGRIASRGDSLRTRWLAWSGHDQCSRNRRSKPGWFQRAGQPVDDTDTGKPTPKDMSWPKAILLTSWSSSSSGAGPRGLARVRVGQQPRPRRSRTGLVCAKRNLLSRITPTTYPGNPQRWARTTIPVVRSGASLPGVLDRTASADANLLGAHPSTRRGERNRTTPSTIALPRVISIVACTWSARRSGWLGDCGRTPRPSTVPARR